MNENQNSNQALQVFNSPEFGAIRTAGTSDEPLFCLADVCRILDLQPSRVKQRLNEGGVTLSKVGVQTGLKLDGTPAIQQVEMIFINEPNLYKVIMRSDKPQAEAFQDWVCGEVLPTIRKTGGYTIPKTYADALALAAQQAKALELQAAQLNEANATIESQNETIAEQKPKADYYDEVLQQQNTYTFTDIAKELGMRSGHELIERLTNRGIVYRKYGKILAYVKYSNQGYFTTRTDLYTTPDGRRGVNYSTVVTEKGREWMHTDYQPATQTTLSL